MAGVQLSAAQGFTDGDIVATVPADESWLVYTACAGGVNVPATKKAGFDLFLSNSGLTVSVAYAEANTSPGGVVRFEPFVLNANDQIVGRTDASTTPDFYCSGLVQRGPGLVPS